MEGKLLKSDAPPDSAERLKVVSMLYDGALNFTKTAREKLETGDSLAKKHYLERASAIVSELSTSLNMEGGQIAQNLKELYDFVLESLIKGDRENDIDAICDAEKVIQILHEAWKEIQLAQRT